jgi:isoleucyl-tRNA synthetase
MRFSWDEVENAARDLNVLWNVARFPQPYMALDGVDPADLSVDAVRGDLEPIDRWVLSRLQSTVGAATEAFEAFQQDDAIEAIREFVVEDVSRYYVQSVRDRMWVEEDDPSKTAAYATLTRVVETTARLLAPFAPFLAEAIDRGVGAADRETVHAADWPAVDDALHDPDLETEIGTVRAVEEAGAHARQRAGRKRRWPIRRLVVDVAGDVDDPASVAAAVREHEALLADRLNAHEVVVVPPDETWDELRHSAEADMSALGPAFGDDAHAVMEACNAARIDAPTVDELESAVADAIGETAELDPGMVEFVPEPPANTAGAGFDGGRVYVDATLTDAIEAEGYAREVIRRVQEARKELGLDVNDRIVLGLDVDDERVADLIADREPLNAREVRADRIGAVDADHEETHEIEGVTVRIAVVPVSGVTA